MLFFDNILELFLREQYSLWNNELTQRSLSCDCYGWRRSLLGTVLIIVQKKNSLKYAANHVTCTLGQCSLCSLFFKKTINKTLGLNILIEVSPCFSILLVPLNQIGRNKLNTVITHRFHYRSSRRKYLFGYFLFREVLKINAIVAMTALNKL